MPSISLESTVDMAMASPAMSFAVPGFSSRNEAALAFMLSMRTSRLAKAGVRARSLRNL